MLIISRVSRTPTPPIKWEQTLFKNIIIILKVSVSLKTYPMVPLYIFITIRVPTPQKRGTKTSPLV